MPGIPTFTADFLLDTTRTAISLILSGSMKRYPGIKFILAHAGGFVPYIADDTKLIFSTNEEPGSDLAGPEQVAFSAGTSTFYDSHTHETYPAFEVSLEFPPGTYYRRTWKDDV